MYYRYYMKKLMIVLSIVYTCNALAVQEHEAYKDVEVHLNNDEPGFVVAMKPVQSSLNLNALSEPMRTLEKRSPCLMQIKNKVRIEMHYKQGNMSAGRSFIRMIDTSKPKISITPTANIKNGKLTLDVEVKEEAPPFIPSYFTQILWLLLSPLM